MNDDLKKTVLQPRFANRPSYHTAVMARSPEMASTASREPTQSAIAKQRMKQRRTVMPARLRQTAENIVPPALSPVVTRVPGAPQFSRATRSVESESPGRVTSMEALRTRMVKARAMPTFYNQVPAAPFDGAPLGRSPHPPPPMPALHVAACRHPDLRKQRVRKVVLLGALAIVLGVGLALPSTRNAKISEVSSVLAQATTGVPHTSSMEPPAAKPGAESGLASAAENLGQPESMRAVATDVTEEQAGAMLLAGRRSEALALYRQLARSPKTSPGVLAMVEVLAQKVSNP